jgi:serine/threonine protein phosphatase PrpC
MKPVADEMLATGRDHFAPEAVRLAGGTALAYTARDPTAARPNEDALALLPLDDERAVIALADGAGGEPGGAEAAALTLRTLQQRLREARSRPPAEGLRAPILDAIEAANRQVLSSLPGALTTLEVVEIGVRYVRSYHIGDSGTLLMGGRGRIKYRTISHSPVGYAVEAGLVEAGEALFHEDLHLVSNLLGTREMRIDIGPRLRLTPRDTLLVASDGLGDNLLPSELVELARRGPLVQVRDRLAALGHRRMLEPAAGAPSKQDDLSFVLFRPGPPRGTAADARR